VRPIEGGAAPKTLAEYPDLMTIQEVADFCRVHHATVRRWLASKQLTGWRLNPKSPKSDWRIYKASLQYFISLRTPKAGRKS
jgi:excisionase family DNA binding protein